MAITLNNSGSGSGPGTGNTISVSATVNAGTDRLLVVGVVIDQDTTTISGVTFNGVAMTNLATASATQSTGNLNVSTWYLINPDVTTANIVVSMSNNDPVGVPWQAFNGVHQSAFLDTANETFGQNDNMNGSIAGVDDGGLIVAFCQNEDNNAATPNTDFNETTDAAVNGGAPRMYAQWRVVATGGSFTPGWLCTPNGSLTDWLVVSSSYKPASTDRVPRHGFVNHQEPGVF